MAFNFILYYFGARMTEEQLAKAYNPDDIEQDIYQMWEEGGYFKPEKQRELGLVTDKSPIYCLTLPPPNITGFLHQGHAITIAIEDLMVRYSRMQGKETLFLPGSDHAGIATQNVVERELRKQGINRKDIGREKFVAKVWEWKHKYGAIITEQSKRMGMSSDWSRERFTLDENLSKAVRTAFVRLFKKDLIYRGQYLVNWCPGRCESAISDLEAEPQEIQSSLWYIRYPIINKEWSRPENEWGSGNWAKNATQFIVIATTRPETLLGDTAVATRNDHPEFASLIGEKAILPVLGRELPIINDDYVDPEFGTGALKITPSHDPNDYEIGKKHDLEFITVIDKKGHMIPEYSGKYANLDRFEARSEIVEDLKRENLLVKIEPHTHSIAHCQRCSTIIEPRISIQWFVKTKSLAKAAMEKVRSGETTILPEREERRFFQWMENISPWTISRQLMWGHRIPVWYCEEGHQTSELEDPKQCGNCGKANLTQDPDVLDTWFSSGLWPFSTLGWPDTKHPDYQKFYPTSMRETGYDILFFWVAREMMLGIEFTGKTPYSMVYLHGIVRNEKGKKISKSMENIQDYDPLKIIKEHGADSLRYTLISNSVPGLDINLDPRQLDAAQRFCNKIWQSTRYILSILGDTSGLPPFEYSNYESAFNLIDRWILSRLHRLIKQITGWMDSYDYLKVAREIKTFYWNEFCDWYLETSKIRLYDESEPETNKTVPKLILVHVLDTSLRLLHPIIPYITEHLWQALPGSIKEVPALIVSKYPQANEKLIDSQAEQEFILSMTIIREIRRIRKDFNVKLSDTVPLILDAGESWQVIEKSKAEIIQLGKVNSETFIIHRKDAPESVTIPSKSARFVKAGIKGYIPLEGLIDIDAVRKRIEKQLDKVNKQIQQLSNKLSGAFAEKAKPEIVQKERENLEKYENTKTQLEEQLLMLN